MKKKDIVDAFTITQVRYYRMAGSATKNLKAREGGVRRMTVKLAKSLIDIMT